MLTTKTGCCGCCHGCGRGEASILHQDTAAGEVWVVKATCQELEQLKPDVKGHRHNRQGDQTGIKCQLESISYNLLNKMFAAYVAPCHS